MGRPQRWHPAAMAHLRLKRASQGVGHLRGDHCVLGTGERHREADQVAMAGFSGAVTQGKPCWSPLREACQCSTEEGRIAGVGAGVSSRAARAFIASMRRSYFVAAFVVAGLGPSQTAKSYVMTASSQHDSNRARLLSGTRAGRSTAEWSVVWQTRPRHRLQTAGDDRIHGRALPSGSAAAISPGSRRTRHHCNLGLNFAGRLRARMSRLAACQALENMV